MPTGFHDIQFPARLAFGAVGGPERRVDIVQLASGFERRNARSRASRRRYTIAAGQRPIKEMREIVAFYEARGGPLNGFRFRDPIEHSTAPDGDVTAFDIDIGVGNSEQLEFTPTLPDGRLIKLIRSVTLKVALDGVALQADFSLNSDTGNITFDTAPNVGAAITAGFEFDVPVRFENEQLLIANASNGAGEIANISLLEIYL